MRRLVSTKTPAQMAAGLSHLEGFIWLDSSGNLRADDHSAISIIVAKPTQMETGDITQMGRLRDLLARNEKAPPALIGGIPNGGWFGTVDYDGAYCFGLYPEILIFHHATKTWFERGELSSRWRATTEFKSPELGVFQESMNRTDFERAVTRIHEYIRSGDLYQVNLCHQFTADLSEVGELFALYQELRDCSPAPMAAFMRQPHRDVLSSSPETFLKFSGDKVVTRPIKGTRPRFADSTRDQQSAYELRTSEKEIAELVMITDLMRNDIGKVCSFGGVQVTEMLKLEAYEHVYHLVSTIEGSLRAGVDALDCLVSCFPGGSITGAPKKRAMEVIAELETVQRGLYTGAIGYLGFNGQSQFSIAIRTLVREGEKLHFHVGSGIVADSCPRAEYEETLHKAKGLRQATANFQR